MIERDDSQEEEEEEEDFLLSQSPHSLYMPVWKQMSTLTFPHTKQQQPNRTNKSENEKTLYSTARRHTHTHTHTEGKHRKNIAVKAYTRKTVYMEKI